MSAPAAARALFARPASAAAAASARRSALAPSAASARAFTSAAPTRASSPSSSTAAGGPAGKPQPQGDGSGLSNASPANPGEIKDSQLGDYPDLPPLSLQRRRWSPNWWDGQEKRNFGETLHEQHDALSVWAPDAAPISPSSALFQFGVAALIMTAFATLVYNTQFERVSVPRTYPRGGLKEELGGTDFVAPSSDDEAEGGEEEDESD